ncbi:recombinase family protein [Clostridium sp. CF012]|uniref:recombinase family protein n=1 Tax=Clostridium sp. CF012 TaxID=2843319 RepID=UPI001C0CEA64|nr:recombinase family protein [Clostridium sp. CF012]MBU3145800.1 recombinase family protein [Clostridium sp. CF012]
MDKKIKKRIAFGYNRGFTNRIEINELQAMAVKLIYELYADGESMGSISSRLEECSVPSPYNNPKWGKQAISKILSYERYIGDEYYAKIIDEDLFKEVQRIRLTKAI